MIFEAQHGSETDVTVFAGGFAALEGEFMLHVAAGSDGKPPADNVAAKSLIDDVRLGLEIAASPYPGINRDGPPVTVSDFGNNRALILGPSLPGWRDLDLNGIVVRSEIDGLQVGEATTATMLDGPYGAVRFLLNHLASRGIGWADGLWVSSGAVTGVHDIAPGQSGVAHFGDFGAIRCRISAI
jgi:2-keto-4-pentenoate hydratase